METYDLNLPIKDYLEDDSRYSSKHLKSVKKSLAHFYYDFVLGFHEEPEGTKLDFGNAFETALLTPDLYDKLVAVKDEQSWIEEVKRQRPELKGIKNSTEYKNFRDKFNEENADKLIIPKQGEESQERLEYMLENCRRDSAIQSFVNNGTYQPSFFFEMHGLPFRTRPDIVRPEKRILVDVKTCLDASPDGFAKNVARMEYPIQAGLHMKGAVESGFMDKVDEYYWLAVEKIPPFNAQLHAVQPDDKDWMMEQVEYLASELAQAKEQNLFPGYTQRVPDESGVNDLELPLFYRSAQNLV
jgi:hypothetical protein